MSRRLTAGGILVNREELIRGTVDGEVLAGHPGDTLASAMLASGRMLMGRSFKYHRPRGPVSAGWEEPNALFGIGAGGRYEPNLRATTVELREGLTAESQNRWPSLKFDVGEVNDRLSRVFPAGFYYKTFMHSLDAWEKVFEPVIRRAAGLGKAPTEPDPDAYEHFYWTADVLVVGGGIAGLAAARAAAEAGASVTLVEQNWWWGGRALVDAPVIDGRPAGEWIDAQVAALSAMENVTLRLRTQAAGVHDHGYVILDERAPEGADAVPGPRRRLWRVRAGRVITAQGAVERPLSFAGNDKPGVMLASAARDYAALWGVAVGARVVVVTNNDDGYRTALALAKAGVTVAAVIDPREGAQGPLARAASEAGIDVRQGMAIRKVEHDWWHVRGAYVCRANGTGAASELVPCDAILMSGGWSPAVHLWSHCGGKLAWDEGTACFRPDPAQPPLGRDGQGFVLTAGTASGPLSTAGALSDAIRAGAHAAGDLGFGDGAPGAAPEVEEEAEAPMAPVWIMPAKAGADLRAKAFLDFQNDVKVSDVELAAREGYESVEHAKRYTTLGMATDQGKLSNINGLAILADALGKPIPQVGTTTFRPPWTPVPLAAIAGDARGELFKPTRKTPMDAWHDANGATWEAVGDWRRPFAYLREGEDVHAAVRREVIAARTGAAMLDASTLGKIIVSGPDAGVFLDRLYTNMMSTLKPGRCRYGLMCTEAGFLFDDGVVVRLSEDKFLCHTTTGGAGRVHAWMEEWLQTEWWDLRVWVMDATEQYAQVAVVGPKARDILRRLGGMDVSREAIPFMGFAEGALGGIPARVHRISFSGELSFEIAVPAIHGQALWDRLLEAGMPSDVQPYGTEAMHVLRAEKGFIMIGDETDGTVTPQDLDLHWAVSKKKDDFIGKRGQMRADLVRADRRRLVGLLTETPGDRLPDGAPSVEDVQEDGRARMTGHVTSSYHSPTLGRSIAMALVEGGMDREGEVLTFSTGPGAVMRAKVVSPVFFDPKGEKQDV
ncbi:sarcosine oxidase subunit alpha family protein [Rhodovulum sp. DZ06]|uniref:sarcosine oxidase subunit alpha family protein n=1 Tax=Rhodovulum sp. DZ06 TaxID=3425126 RepID=UPI003D33B756